MEQLEGQQIIEALMTEENTDRTRRHLLWRKVHSTYETKYIKLARRVYEDVSFRVVQIYKSYEHVSI